MKPTPTKKVIEYYGVGHDVSIHAPDISKHHIQWESFTHFKLKQLYGKVMAITAIGNSLLNLQDL